MKILTQRGYDLFEVASALQKSIRRNDVKLAGYMALELFPKFANYCWKRLLTISAEDCSGIITQEIKALYDSFQVINKGKKSEDFKGRIFISKAVIILCSCKHNRDADVLQNYIYDKKHLISDDEIESLMADARTEMVQMPEYVFDIHTMKGKRSGKTKTDFFVDEDEALANKTETLFDGLQLSLW